MGLILMPILIFYVAVILATTFYVAVKQKMLSKKILFSVLIPAVFFIGPVLDQIIGKVYFDYLCESRSGLYVYDNVKLDATEFDSQGNLKYISTLKNFYDFNYSGEYKTGLNINKNQYSKLGIKKSSIFVESVKSGKVYGEYVTYQFSGGYLARRLSGAIAGGMLTCGKINQKSRKQLISSVFIRN